jgi:hypothetical protein
MIEKSELRDDLDKVSASYKPRAAYLAITNPAIGTNYFDPTAEFRSRHFSSITAATIRRLGAEEFASIPTELPSQLGTTAALVYNNNMTDAANRIKYARLDEIVSKSRFSENGDI